MGTLAKVQKETIPPVQMQSFRLFSWEDNKEEVWVDLGDGELVQEKGEGRSWHYHPEIELTMIIEGEGTRYVGDDVSLFQGPELVLLGRNLPHYWDSETSKGFCIQFSFEPTSPLASIHESVILQKLVQRADKGLLFSSTCTQELRVLLEQCCEARGLERLGIFFKMMQRLANAKSKTISSCVPQGVAASGSVGVQRAVQYIVEHAAEESLSLAEVLDHVKMSRATFSRHFQNALGQSFTQLLQAIRLERSRKLLMATEDSITGVAYASGFSNLSHFNALFKKRWGMTPRQFRKMGGV